MNEIATPAYARALLAVCADRMIELLAIVAADEADEVMVHRIAEVKAECAWAKRNYGEAER